MALLDKMKKPKTHQPAISRFFAPKPKATAEPASGAPAPLHKRLSGERDSLTPVRDGPPRTPGKSVSDGGQVTVSPDKVLSTKRKEVSKDTDDASAKRRKVAEPDKKVPARAEAAPTGDITGVVPDADTTGVAADADIMEVVPETVNSRPTQAASLEKGEEPEHAFPKSDPVRHAKFVEKLLARSDNQGQLSERAGAAQLTGPGVKYTPLELQVGGCLPGFVCWIFPAIDSLCSDMFKMQADKGKSLK